MKRKYITFITFISLLGPVGGSWAHAQADSDSEELNLIEMELDKSASPQQIDERPDVAPSKDSDTSNTQALFEKKDRSDSSEFKQVAIIQKRYLPRTGRFQFFAGPSMTLNDPWFNVLGASLKLGYNFTEALGIEGNYSFLSTDKTQALSELHNENGITTKNFVYTKSYYLINLNWSPMYGKMTWLNKEILYYDIYFNVGLGGTQIQNNQNEDTFSVGAGQIFSITKTYAFRWDLSWNFFNAKQIDSSQGTFNNVIISAGLSFFFPEALYR